MPTTRAAARAQRPTEPTPIVKPSPRTLHLQSNARRTLKDHVEVDHNLRPTAARKRSPYARRGRARTAKGVDCADRRSMSLVNTIKFMAAFYDEKAAEVFRYLQRIPSLRGVEGYINGEGSWINMMMPCLNYLTVSIKPSTKKGFCIFIKY